MNVWVGKMGAWSEFSRKDAKEGKTQRIVTLATSPLCIFAWTLFSYTTCSAFSSIHPTSTQLILTKAQFAPSLIIFEYHNRVEVEKEAADLDIINFDFYLCPRTAV